MDEKVNERKKTIFGWKHVIYDVQHAVRLILAFFGG